MSKGLPTELGVKVKLQLVSKHMTLSEVAMEFKTSVQYLNMIIYGRRGTGKYTSKIANFLDTTEQEVIKLSKQKHHIRKAC